MLSPAEIQLLKFIGTEGIQLVSRIIKIVKDNNIDLDELMEKARADNKTTIFDDEG